MIDQPLCPGHDDKCEFCSEVNGRLRYVGESVEVNQQGQPVVDPCCKHCGSNLSYENKFDSEVAARLR